MYFLPHYELNRTAVLFFFLAYPLPKGLGLLSWCFLDAVPWLFFFSLLLLLLLLLIPCPSLHSYVNNHHPICFIWLLFFCRCARER
jgi:hypothetical protein